MEAKTKPKVKPKAKRGRKQTYNCAEGTARVIDNYFKDCDKRDAPYTMAGLAAWLHIDRSTLINYGKKAQFSALIRDAKARVNAQIEERMMSGDVPPGSATFLLKNNYGYVDKMEVKQDLNATTKLSVEKFFEEDKQDA
ncbi:MAG: DNA-packaging protein [Prevotella sp.]|jgi:hypothetical protein|nr:DNA-packaging protein [Prevotella sp.]